MDVSSQQIVIVAYGATTPNSRSSDAATPTLSHELEMARPALLYSDRVSLVSTMYQINRDFFDAYRNIEEQPERLVTVTETLFPPIAWMTPGWADLAALRDRALHAHTPRRKRRKARAQIQKLVGDFRKAQAFRMFDERSFVLLREAEAAGVLSIEALPGVDLSSVGQLVGQMLAAFVRAAMGAGNSTESFDELMTLTRAATRRLIEVIEDPHSYPVLDPGARSLVRSNRPPAGFSVNDRDRSRVGGLANHVMGHLPVLDYDLRDLAEIRATLSDQLGAFQVAIAGLAGEISSAQWDDDFESEVAQLYRTQIAPPLRDLNAKLDDFRAHGKRRARRRAVSEAAFRGLNVFVGLGTGAYLVHDWVDTALVALLGLPPSLAAVGTKLVRDIHEEINAELGRMQSNRFYYLAAAQDLLTRPTID